MMSCRSRCAAAAAALAVSVLATCAPANGQCEAALPPLGFPGANGPVHASTTWDPDGAGPSPELLIVGGEFHGVGGTVARHIAAWDGSNWRAMGSGIGWSGGKWPWAVMALTTYGGDLIAGGNFAEFDGVAAWGVARWNGSEWLPLGTGLDNTVLALTEFNGELIAGGVFPSADGVSVNGIARWNGSAWQPLGAGVSGEDEFWTVRALAVYGGELIAAGVFTGGGGMAAQNIARWDGAQWRALGPGGPHYEVRSLAVYGGELIVADGNEVLAWDGAAWRQIGPAGPWWTALVVYGGELIRGGASAQGWEDVMSRWDGSVWRPLGAGITGDGASNVFINTMTVYRGELIVGGEFNNAGGVPAANLARWDGKQWMRVASGVSGEVRVLMEHEGKLIAAGSFAGAGETDARDVARWDGLAWQPMGTGFAHPQYQSSVLALANYGGELITAGLFASAGEEAAACIARWTGSAWLPLGAGLSGGNPALVRALAVHGGELFAGGTFTAAGGTPAANIARWDGAEWRPLGTGLAGCVHAMASFGGELVVSGCFIEAGGVPAMRLAKWDGSTWSALGAGSETPVHLLDVYGGELIATGSFTSIAGAPVSGIARWDGSQWRALGPGPGLSSIRAMAVTGGKLYAAGSTGGAASVRITMRWDGQGWDAVEESEGHSVFAMAPFRGEVVAWGGTLVDGLDFVSKIGRWSESGIPWIAREPEAQAVPVGGSAAFAVAAALGYEGLAFQWFRDGAPIADGHGGVSVGGGTVVGATLPGLTISGVRASDAGAYTCVVSNGCGGLTSAAAALVVQGADCAADWNGDALVSSNDISAFLTVWLASVLGGTLAADFNGDEAVNSDDISAFLTAWLAAVMGGC